MRGMLSSVEAARDGAAGIVAADPNWGIEAVANLPSTWRWRKEKSAPYLLDSDGSVVS